MLKQPASRTAEVYSTRRRRIVVEDTVNILFFHIVHILLTQITARAEDNHAFVFQLGNGGRGSNRFVAFKNGACRPLFRILTAQIKAVHTAAAIAGIGDIDCAVQIFIHQRGGRKPALAVGYVDCCNRRTVVAFQIIHIQRGFIVAAGNFFSRITGGEEGGVFVVVGFADLRRADGVA
ncbi:Uncharacterised protein [Neisseria meningitidis]|nr:Uncharacterised protein [Neisseria meningitidis]CWT00520.1 Uncharacterised protein [Neisseria meningitidis]